VPRSAALGVVGQLSVVASTVIVTWPSPVRVLADDVTFVAPAAMNDTGRLSTRRPARRGRHRP
jgi:hypothetical protein